MMEPQMTVRSQVILTADASGSWGFGGYTSGGEWVSYQWLDSLVHVYIKVKDCF